MANETETLSTSWIWPTGNGVNGLRVDTDKEILHWYNAIGCTCDTSLVDQRWAEFHKKGIPVGIVNPPEDVQKELNQLLNNG